jgi:hypothetical protein
VKHAHACAVSVIDHQIDDHRVIRDLHAGERRYPKPEHAADFASRGVARVQHTSRAVRPFDCQRRLAARRAIERRTPGHQLANVPGSLPDEHANGALIAQAVAGGNRVGRVQVR